MTLKRPNNTNLQLSQKRSLAGKVSNSSYGTQKRQNFLEELPAVGVSFINTLVSYFKTPLFSFEIEVHCNNSSIKLEKDFFRSN